MKIFGPVFNLPANQHNQFGLDALHFDRIGQKYSRLRCLLRVKGLVISFYLGWSGSILQFRQNIVKVGSKSWLLSCSINLSLHCFCFLERAILVCCISFVNMFKDSWIERLQSWTPPSSNYLSFLSERGILRSMILGTFLDLRPLWPILYLQFLAMAILD